MPTENDANIGADCIDNGNLSNGSNNNSGSRRIVLNVGGHRYETSTETLRRIPDTRLTRLLDESDDGVDEIFVDRCGEIFYLVLNFLRVGTIASDAVGEKDLELIERLEKEYYGISELANLCRLERDALKSGETVCWRASAIPHYWRLFVKCIVDKTLSIPFTFERNATFFRQGNRLDVCVGEVE